MLSKTAMLRSAAASRCGATAVRATAVCLPVQTNTASFSSSSPPPPSIAPRANHSEDPSLYDQSKEDMRLHYRSYEESKYKLGKHRSNALELIEKVPVVEVEGERAICDGGGGALGHPLEYISLQRPNVIERCKYCGLRFKSKAWAH